MSQKVVIFDFDGVLVDSFAVGLQIIRRVVPELTEESYRERFEGNINNKIWKKEPPRKEIDFFALYRPALLKLPLVPGIDAVVRELASRYRLVIVSSTITPPIQEFLEQHGLVQFFMEILGNDIDPSKAVKLRMVLKKYQVSIRDCIFITDTLGDIREATEVGISSIAVAWGHHPSETLERGNPSRVVRTPEQLISTIDEHW